MAVHPRLASKQTSKIDNVEHTNSNDREIGPVESSHPRKWPNFRYKVQVQSYQMPYYFFHRFGKISDDLKCLAWSGCVANTRSRTISVPQNEQMFL